MFYTFLEIFSLNIWLILHQFRTNFCLFSLIILSWLLIEKFLKTFWERSREIIGFIDNLLVVNNSFTFRYWSEIRCPIDSRPDFCHCQGLWHSNMKTFSKDGNCNVIFLPAREIKKRLKKIHTKVSQHTMYVQT